MRNYFLRFYPKEFLCLSLNLCLSLCFPNSNHTADHAAILVNANYIPAARAGPFFLFKLREFPYTVFINAIQVFNHAHTEFSAVTVVEVFNSSAGIVSAFIAEFCIILCKLFTIFYRASKAMICFGKVSLNAAETPVLCTMISQA